MKSLKYEHTSIGWKTDGTNRISNYKEEGEQKKTITTKRGEVKKKQLNRTQRRK